jgi:acyl dehydratase
MPIIVHDIAVGTALPLVARQFRNEMFGLGDVKTIHNDDDAARREGLPRAVAVGPQVAALIFRMMRSCFEDGWIVGGKSALTFRRPVWSNDFATARGFVTATEPEGDRVRVVCDVWVERADGEQAIVGTCSALVPGPTA